MNRFWKGFLSGTLTLILAYFFIQSEANQSFTFVMFPLLGLVNLLLKLAMWIVLLYASIALLKEGKWYVFPSFLISFLTLLEMGFW